MYFYDNQLRLLYWCKDCGFDSIVSISFGRDSNLQRPENTPSESTNSRSPSLEDILGSTDEEEISSSSKSEVEIDQEKMSKERNMDSGKIGVFSSGIHSKETPLESTENFASSTITIDIDYLTSSSRNHSTKGKFLEPSDCTLQAAFFAVPIFVVCEPCDFSFILLSIKLTFFIKLINFTQRLLLEKSDDWISRN